MIESRHSQAGRDGEIVELNLFDVASQTFRCLFSLTDIGLWQQNAEFFSTIAADNVCVARCLANRLGDSAKNFVSHAVTVGVVDRLEMVNVDHVATQRLLIAAGRTPQFVEGLKERAPV